MSRDELRSAVFALPTDEKLKLVEELWDSIAEDELPPLTQGQLDEIERREAYLEANPDSLLTWEQVLEHIRSRHGR
jgi:putative addiction module component (TIGR02574 family)